MVRRPVGRSVAVSETAHTDPAFVYRALVCPSLGASDADDEWISKVVVGPSTSTSK